MLLDVLLIFILFVQTEILVSHLSLIELKNEVIKNKKFSDYSEELKKTLESVLLMYLLTLVIIFSYVGKLTILIVIFNLFTALSWWAFLPSDKINFFSKISWDLVDFWMLFIFFFFGTIFILTLLYFLLKSLLTVFWIKK